MATQPIDFSAGLVPAPQGSNSIDFSAGLIPAEQATPPSYGNGPGETQDYLTKAEDVIGAAQNHVVDTAKGLWNAAQGAVQDVFHPSTAINPVHNPANVPSQDLFSEAGTKLHNAL